MIGQLGFIRLEELFSLTRCAAHFFHGAGSVKREISWVVIFGVRSGRNTHILVCRMSHSRIHRVENRFVAQGDGKIVGGFVVLPVGDVVLGFGRGDLLKRLLPTSLG